MLLKKIDDMCETVGLGWTFIIIGVPILTLVQTLFYVVFTLTWGVIYGA